MMKSMLLAPGHPCYPPGLGQGGPTIAACGDVHLLRLDKTGIFASVKASGTRILDAISWARQFPRDAGVVIGGFHSPIEQECMNILVVGGVSVGWFLARSIEGYRALGKWRDPIAAGRMLVLSATGSQKRVTALASQRRNELVAQMADSLLILHAEPASSTADLARRFAAGNKRVDWLGET